MDTFKVIIIGDSSVGKSSLLHSYINKDFIQSYKATVGADLLVKEITVNNKPAIMQVS